MFPREEYEQRWARLQAEMVARGHSTAVFWQRTGGSYDGAGDVYYLTNYASQANGQEPTYGRSFPSGRAMAALIVQVGREPELHAAEPPEMMNIDDIACGEIFGHTENLGEGIATRLRKLGVEGKVPYHGDTILPMEIYRDLAAGTPAIEWVPEHRLLYPLFSQKSPRELEAYRKAGEIASRAMDALMDALVAGERECDAAAKAAAIVVGSGGGFQRIGCHHGPRSEAEMWNNPLYGYSTEAPKHGDVVRAWIYGPIYQGYWIDPGRTSVCGRKPSSDQRELIENSVSIIEAIMAAHRPGITARELGVIGDQLMQGCGYELDPNAVWALYGHSISGFWMEPIIPAFGNVTEKVAEGWRVDEPFHVGQVCTVEIFLPVSGVGQAAFEQVFILQEDGIEILTTTPMLFW